MNHYISLHCLSSKIDGTFLAECDQTYDPSAKSKSSGSDFKNVTFKHKLQIKFMSTSR